MNSLSDWDIQQSIQNLASGNFTESDIQILRSAHQSKRISASGGGVATGGNISGSIIMTGSNNSITIQGSGASAIRRITKPFYQEVGSVLSSWLISSSIASAAVVLNTPKSVDFFMMLFSMFPAFTIVGCFGIMYEKTFKNKSDFSYSFGYWSIYPIWITAEIEIKFMIFLFKLLLLIKW
jgi:hypothetical protein